MAVSRRDLLKGKFKTDSGELVKDIPAQPDIPEGKDIHLFPETCIAWGRGVCVRCEKVCPEAAIYFVGMMSPRIIDSRCTLCGDCLPPCPVKAIVIKNQAGD